jgi:sugar phosphate isomerase/epimerase
MDVSSRQRVMWGPTIGIRRTPFDIVDGAAAAGYAHATVTAENLSALGVDGRQLLHEHLDERGVHLSFIDGYYQWQPLEGTKLAATACPLEEILEFADEFDSRFIGALALPLGLPFDDLADRFAGPSRQIGDAGRVLTLEFSPLAGVYDLAAADAVISPSGYGSAGILFDTWHFYRGTPDFELLSSMTAGQIAAVQISDAAAEIQESLWKDTIRYRRQPGDGTFDLPKVINALEAVGALDWYGPEVINSDHDAMDPEEVGRLSGQRLDELLASL